MVRSLPPGSAAVPPALDHRSITTGGLHQGIWAPVTASWFPVRSLPDPVPPGLAPPEVNHDKIAVGSSVNGPLQPVPEPETIVMFSMSLLALGWLLWSRLS